MGAPHTGPWGSPGHGGGLPWHSVGWFCGVRRGEWVQAARLEPLSGFLARPKEQELGVTGLGCLRGTGSPLPGPLFGSPHGFQAAEAHSPVPHWERRIWIPPWAGSPALGQGGTTGWSHLGTLDGAAQSPDSLTRQRRLHANAPHTSAIQLSLCGLLGLHAQMQPGL